MKQRVIMEGRSEGEQVAYELGAYVASLNSPVGDDGPRKPRKIIIDLSDVCDLVMTRRGIKQADKMKYLEKPARLRKMLVAAGMKEPHCDASGERQRFTIDHKSTEVVANFQIQEGAAWPELKQYHQKLKILVPSWWSSPW
jgi:hypothetical protein